MLKSASKLSQYIDPSGDFSTKDFKRGMWYVRHKLLLRRLVIGILLTWNIVTIGIGIFVWSNYALFGYWNDNRLLASHLSSAQNYTLLQSGYTAQPLVFGTSNIFNSSEGKYDFVTEVTNANTSFAAVVNFRYTYGGNKETTSATRVLLPNATDMLALFGHSETQYPTQATLVIDDIRWQRIDAHRIPNPRTFMDERLRFTIENFSFTPSGSIESGGAGRVSFDVTNASVYSYWEPVFYLSLKRSGSVVGVLPFSQKEFRAGETRRVDIATFLDILSVDDSMLLSVVNVFDPDVYLPVGE